MFLPIDPLGLAATGSGGATPPPPPVCGPRAGLLAQFACDPLGSINRWGAAISAWLWWWITAYWPLLVLVVAVALAVPVLVVRARRCARRDAIEHGTWLAIRPPAVLPPDGALGLWRALAAILHEHRPGLFGRWIGPCRLAAEFVATGRGVRVGLWVPPTLPAIEVTDAVRQAWPSARVTTHTPGFRWERRRVSAMELLPPGGEWTPLIDPTPASRWPRPATEVGQDPLRWLLSTLGRTNARRRRGELACVQLVVSAHRHSARHWAGHGGSDRRWWARLLLGGFKLLAHLVLKVFDFFLDRSPSTSSRPTVRPAGSAATVDADPAVMAARKARDAKRAAGPHLTTTIRVAVGMPAERAPSGRAGRSARWGRVKEIAGGFRLVTPAAMLRRRPARHADMRVAARLHGHTFAATLPELAALWHVPTEPTRYGLDDQPARNRPTTPDLDRWRPARTHAGTSPTRPTSGTVTTTGRSVAAMPRDHHTTNHPQQTDQRRHLPVVPLDDPRRQRSKPLGVSNDDPDPAVIGLRVPDARHHVHVPGVTGAGKSTWLAHHVLAEARSGRGVVLLDCQGDLARNVLDRLPASCGRRLVILDPAETLAPPAWNVLAPIDPTSPTGSRGAGSDGLGDDPRAEVAGREWAAENVVGVFRRLYAAWWGPRMDDLLRAACLTLARRPGSTLADVVPLLTSTTFRHQVLDEHGEPEGLDGFWSGYDELSAGQRAQLCAPLLSRLRAVLARRFPRDLLAAARSSFNLTDILNGGILIARLAKGEIGEDTARLVGSLLLSGLWAHATRRSAIPPEQRPDATIVIDECHNFLHLPIGIEDALAEARGYRISLVLAHQHLGQLSPEIRDAIDANARNKILFTVSPTDAGKLVRHVAPFLEERDLSARPAFEVVARIVHQGRAVPPFTLDTLPLPDAVPGRAEALREAARRHSGLPAARRQDARQRRRLTGQPGTDLLLDRPVTPAGRGDEISDDDARPAGGRQSPRHSPRQSVRQSLRHLQRHSD